MGEHRRCQASFTIKVAAFDVVRAWSAVVHVGPPVGE